ncbi:MAG: methyltransferase domain-containing protein [Gammaproteobacteria bacterium]
MRREAQALGALVTGFSGTLAVQIGVPEVDYLRETRYAGILRADVETPAAMLRTRTDALPLATACADLVLLAHVLDESPAPAGILAECARILRGEGRLVIVARRPFALSAWTQWPTAAIGGGRFSGCRQLRTLAEEAGLVWRGGAGFAPRGWGRNRSASCPRLGASSFAALAVKRVAGMTVLKPAWSDGRERRRKPVLQGQEHAG